MPTTDAEGATLYGHPDTFTDILFNGVSILDQHPIAVKVWPTGYGWVLLQINPSTGLEKTWVDGQKQNYWKYGYITVVP